MGKPMNKPADEDCDHALESLCHAATELQRLASAFQAIGNLTLGLQLAQLVHDLDKSHLTLTLLVMSAREDRPT